MYTANNYFPEFAPVEKSRDNTCELRVWIQAVESNYKDDLSACIWRVPPSVCVKIFVFNIKILRQIITN